MRGLVPQLLAAGLLLLATAADAGSGPLPGNRFPVHSSSYYLTADAATVANHTGVLTLAPQPPAQQGMAQFLAPGLHILGLLKTPSTIVWYSPTPWGKDVEVVEDASARLHFAANPQALTTFEVRLHDVSPDGTVTRVANNVQQFVAVGGTTIDFPLAIAGVQFRQGHFLVLELYAQTSDALIVLHYGGETPSGLPEMQWRLLDSDGDGVSDSDEMASGHNPLDPTDVNADLAVDTDRDGLADEVEDTLGTDPAKVDTDGDGFGDGVEVHAGSDPLDRTSRPSDLNGNGLPDTFEARWFNTTNITYNAAPCTPGAGCVDPDGDPDGDGCNNLCEAAHGTDPTSPDSDGDGVLDGDEVEAGTDPARLDVVVLPRLAIPEPVAAAGLFAGTSVLSLFALLRRP